MNSFARLVLCFSIPPPRAVRHTEPKLVEDAGRCRDAQLAVHSQGIGVSEPTVRG